jgi:hypothetical protein
LGDIEGTVQLNMERDLGQSLLLESKEEKKKKKMLGTV